MAGNRWLLLAAGVILSTSGGCAVCSYEACKPVLEAGPTCDLPIASRRNVYVFMVNGLTPAGMCGLRDKLFEAGYPKVSYGQLVHAIPMGYEMRRIHKNEPDARFVIIGYDLGAAAAVCLAKDAVEDGLPVDALVLLDPMGNSSLEGCGSRTVLIRSGAATATVPHSETISVSESGHFTLPSHPQTVVAVTNLLADIACKIPVALPAFYSDFNPEFAPPPRLVPTPDQNADPAWNFLYDYPGGTTESLTPVISGKAQAPTPSDSNSRAPWPGLAGMSMGRPGGLELLGDSGLERLIVCSQTRQILGEDPRSGDLG